MSSSEFTENGYASETEDGVEYTPHSMIHRGVLDMDPTKLDMLDNFERADSGYKYIPPESNIRVIITGRDWSEKRILIYGSDSTKEARQHFQDIIDQVHEIGHSAEQVRALEITNIAVNGDFGEPLQLESVINSLRSEGLEVEYEPEQFPAVIVKLEELEVTFLLFSTGKFSIQGLITLDNIEKSINHILKYLGKSQYD
jgi:TATA-box binding protein (TBP) (component of TFIID and TFIIIB)